MAFVIIFFLLNSEFSVLMQFVTKAIAVGMSLTAVALDTSYTILV